MSNLHVVVGGQFGSEAKGHVAAQLVQRISNQQRRMLQDPRDNVAVRVGGPNAGHSVVDDEGNVWALRQIPVAAPISQWRLCIASGSEVDPKVLDAEISALDQAGHDVSARLVISAQATKLESHHISAEQTDGLQQRIGSTAKGIGAARRARLGREADLYGALERHGGAQGVDQWLAGTLTMERAVVIEGTQGYGLGLHAGFYPYCTAGDCRAVDFLAQAGLPPTGPGYLEGPDTWVVFRTFPIRVAGNSGPMYLERSWEYLAEEYGDHIKPEFTTVTKKMRRVGEWDRELARAALVANGGASNPKTHPVLTFVDYLDPKLAGSESMPEIYHSPCWPIIRRWERELDCEFEAFTTGPNTMAWRDGSRT